MMVATVIAKLHSWRAFPEVYDREGAPVLVFIARKTVLMRQLDTATFCSLSFWTREHLKRSSGFG